jgi:hypothetical protein
MHKKRFCGGKIPEFNGPERGRRTQNCFIDQWYKVSKIIA